MKLWSLELASTASTTYAMRRCHFRKENILVGWDFPKPFNFHYLKSLQNEVRIFAKYIVLFCETMKIEVKL